MIFLIICFYSFNFLAFFLFIIHYSLRSIQTLIYWCLYSLLKLLFFGKEIKNRLFWIHFKPGKLKKKKCSLFTVNLYTYILSKYPNMRTFRFYQYFGPKPQIWEILENCEYMFDLFTKCTRRNRKFCGRNYMYYMFRSVMFFFRWTTAHFC